MLFYILLLKVDEGSFECGCESLLCGYMLFHLLNAVIGIKAIFDIP